MSGVVADILGFEPTLEQRRAITFPLEPCLIMAGAGTGKTTVMSARIAWLVSEGTSPSRILGLTFTTKAAGELATRVRRDLATLSGRTGLGSEVTADTQPTISTYNAFGAQLLREHAVRIGLEPDARVVVDALRYQLAYRVIANTSVDLGAVGYDPRSAVSDLLALDQALADYLLEPAEVAARERERASEYLRSEYQLREHEAMVRTCGKRAAILEVVEEFRTAKAKYDIIDYSDQIRLAAKAAAASPAMAEALRAAYDIVLLDEYQDTSVSQKLLLQRLFGGGFPVTAVGDPLQSIYRWRGADVSNITDFASDFPTRRKGQLVPSETLPLSENWRSTQQVLDIANHISVDLRKIHAAPDLTAGRPDLPPAAVEAALFGTFGEELTWIARRLHELGSSIPWRKMAVLMRDKKNIGSLVNELEALGVPVQVADAGSLFALPEVREVLCYLQVLADPTDNPSLARLLAGPRWRLGSRDLALLGEYAHRLANPRQPDVDQPFDLQLEHVVAGRDAAERTSLVDALEQADSIAGCSPEARARMAELAAELRQLRRHLGEPLPDLVARVVRTTGLGIEALTRTFANGASRYDRLAMLFDVIGGFADLDGRSSLESFLSYVRDSDRFSVTVEAELPLTREAVTVMSVHKSKGLEYSVVALPGMSRDTFPSTVSDKYWVGNAHVLPPHYRPGSPDPDLVRFPGDVEDMRQDLDSHKARVRLEKEQDEFRLAYVAVTRAAHHLLACGSWWGPTQVSKKGPSPFLEVIKAHATEVPLWEPEPATQQNPTLDNAAPPTWPVAVDPDALAALREQAALVRRHLTANLTGAELELTMLERALVEEWDTDIAAVREQLRVSQLETRVVRLPDSLTASQVIALRAEPDRFVTELVRPMPQPPSRAADRGTVFHAWVEEFYGSRGLFEPDSLPGAVDDAIYSDSELDALKRAFESGQFAQRTPHAMEAPFALLIAGRPLRGRIDAVFRGTVDDPTAPGKWLVVDWKTGAPGSADPVQLDIYRHAWAEAARVEVEDVAAAFYYVAADHLEPLVQPRSLDELTSLLSAPAP